MLSWEHICRRKANRHSRYRLLRGVTSNSGYARKRLVPTLSAESVDPVVEGSRVEIVCRGNAERVEWYHGARRAFFPNEKKNGKFVMKIQPVTNDHNGVYTCKGRYFRTTKTEEASVKVIVRSKPTASVNIVEPTKGKLTLGKKVTLECKVTGNPNPAVTWLFRRSKENQTLLTNSIKVQLNTLQPQHEGNYCCNAVNTVGQAYECIEISIEGESMRKCVYAYMYIYDESLIQQSQTRLNIDPS